MQSLPTEVIFNIFTHLPMAKRTFRDLTQAVELNVTVVNEPLHPTGQRTGEQVVQTIFIHEVTSQLEWKYGIAAVCAGYLRQQWQHKEGQYLVVAGCRLRINASAIPQDPVVILAYLQQLITLAVFPNIHVPPKLALLCDLFQNDDPNFRKDTSHRQDALLRLMGSLAPKTIYHPHLFEHVKKMRVLTLYPPENGLVAVFPDVQSTVEVLSLKPRWTHLSFLTICRFVNLRLLIVEAGAEFDIDDNPSGHKLVKLKDVVFEAPIDTSTFVSIRNIVQCSKPLVLLSSSMKSFGCKQSAPTVSTICKS
ncbi:hypothetical protein HDU76_013403 [Blyttiomyces sp. JEL0837]|nr:hypothetical protein HDU76_013403 [Blyttiomyces sp. JEL0837]